ncbi:MAG: metallophosphoesterase [Coprococcus sp.]|nr:metallophosphoesterase [Coprococcus sp.]
MKYVLIFFVILICIFVIFVFVESYRENRIISVSRYVLESEKLTQDITAVMIADLHNSEYGKDNQELIEKIDALKPDMILVAGDSIIGKEGYTCDIAIKLLNKLGEKYRVYVGKGNHELRCAMYTEQYGDMWEQLYNGTKDKVKWLINDAVYLDENNITIYGFDMERQYYRRFKKLPMEDSCMRDALPKLNRSSYSILLAHNPDYFEEYSIWGADLSLSGHIHGGMIIFPGLGGFVSPMIRFFPKYYKGIYKNGNSRMIVSAGLGIHTFKFRVNNKPDLVYITLNRV